MAATRLTPEETKARIQQMLSFQRQEELDPFRVMAFLPIDPYYVVADIGSGPGFFTIALAKYLVQGKVYAVDTSQEMLDVLRQRVKETYLGNVEMVHSQEYHVPIEPESLDGALAAFVLGEVEDRAKLLKSVTAALKPGAWLAVVEWLPNAKTDYPVPSRVPPDSMKTLAKAVGLRLGEVRELSGKHYMAMFRRPKAAKA